MSAPPSTDRPHAGLPVSLVQRDAGGSGIGGIMVNFGDGLERDLLGSPAVAGKLDIHGESMAAAEDQMDRGASYATVIVRRGFTHGALNLADAPGNHPAPPGPPTVALLASQRAGTEGASLATGVLTPALEAISRGLGAKFLHESGAGASTAALGLSTSTPPC